jgi:hypothetical protein
MNWTQRKVRDRRVQIQRDNEGEKVSSAVDKASRKQLPN